jgi:hypothetical protein
MPDYAIVCLIAFFVACVPVAGFAFSGEARLSVTKLVTIPVASEALVSRDVRTLLGNGALHHEHEHDERDRERREDEEGIEIGERGGLQLTQVLE